MIKNGLNAIFYSLLIIVMPVVCIENWLKHDEE